ncbi:CRISPR-associated endonuclease Cas2 [bacterium endosymbiont of Escarpia laminata]|nr:MAG: CRISPR-associated endonuclease Cas2 [bacterium endosymbiont of Escarpia laminata]
MNQPLQQLWVIAYDIEDDAIRRRIHNLLKDHGQRVQYSVFECWLDTSERQKLRTALQQEVDPGDQIRCYPLCQWCSKSTEWQGKGSAAENSDYYLP